VAGELVAGLRVVFATFTKDVGANVQSVALSTQVKKEMIAVVYATTGLGI
jgi:hypothetical protein